MKGSVYGRRLENYSIENSLPDELLMEILKFTTHKEQHSMSLVSKRFLKLFRRDKFHCFGGCGRKYVCLLNSFVIFHQQMQYTGNTWSKIVGIKTLCPFVVYVPRSYSLFSSPDEPGWFSCPACVHRCSKCGLLFSSSKAATFEKANKVCKKCFLIKNISS
jgi:F-box domain